MRRHSIIGERVLMVVPSMEGVAALVRAMTECRPYGPARPPEEAIAELKACAGTQFDPTAVDAFLQVLKAGGGLAALRPAA